MTVTDHIANMKTMLATCRCPFLCTGFSISWITFIAKNFKANPDSICYFKTEYLKTLAQKNGTQESICSSQKDSKSSEVQLRITVQPPTHSKKSQVLEKLIQEHVASVNKLQVFGRVPKIRP